MKITEPHPIGLLHHIVSAFDVHLLSQFCNLFKLNASLDLPQKTQINEVTHFALTAIEAFTDKHLTQCGNLTDIPCRFQSMVDKIDTNYPYER